MIHAKIIDGLLESDGYATQQELADAINALRTDGKRANQSTVSKWRSGNKPVGVEEAVCIELLTDGRRSASEFYPCIERLLIARNERAVRVKCQSKRTRKQRVAKPLRQSSQSTSQRIEL